jgi:TPP-dependent pyruvate/acetoin dehydrogenase alpha subunit
MPDKHIRGQSAVQAGAARITQASTTRAAMFAGEEATIVGLTSVMRPDDYLIGTYRAAARSAGRPA